MLNTIHKFFTLTFKHDYFGDQSPNSTFELGANLPAQQRVMQRLVGEETFFFQMDAHSAKSIKRVVVPIQINDTDFFNYTQLETKPPTNSNAKFHTRYFNSSTAVDGVLHAAGAIQLPVVGFQFAYPLSAEQSKELTSITLSSLGDPSLQGSLSLSQKNANAVLIDVSAFGPGGYRIDLTFERLAASSYAFFASDTLAFKPVPMVFEWHQVAEQIAPNYQLSFAARPVYWRYLFIGLSANDQAKSTIPSVTINGEQVAFIPEKEQVALPNGQTAFAYHSERPIPLYYRPNFKVQLQAPFTETPIQLPTPQARILQSLHPPIVPTEDFCADTYVYL
ncbi:MAG: hypothetical protein AAF798_09675 [Bacteroidota bacterium]